MRSKSNGYLVLYDVSEDKRRNKVEKIVSEYGIRVQYSCFYCPVEKQILLSLLLRLNKVIDTKTDSVIAVALTADWKKYTVGTLKNEPTQFIKHVI